MKILGSMKGLADVMMWTAKTQKPVIARPSSIQISIDENQSTSPPRSSISCNAPMPSDSMAKPKKSKPRRRLAVSGRKAAQPRKARMPTGRLMKNTQRQLIAFGQPAAQRRAEDRPDHDAGAPHGHRLSRAAPWD